MTYKINPAFDRYPQEGELVGRMLSSFGELELGVCQAAQAAVRAEESSVLRALYTLRTTSSRLDVADCLMQPIYEAHELAECYSTSIGMVRKCLSIRNQYAHCNWADHDTGGLFFADLQTSAGNRNFDHFYRHVDVPLLSIQLYYFKVTQEWLRFTDSRLMVKTGSRRPHSWPEPPALIPPPLHNPPSEHVPPWISADAQAAHLERSRALEGIGQQPKRAPSVPRLTEDEWVAKYRKEGKPLPDNAE
jgi:hypothetical protein